MVFYFELIHHNRKMVKRFFIVLFYKSKIPIQIIIIIKPIKTKINGKSNLRAN